MFVFWRYFPLFFSFPSFLLFDFVYGERGILCYVEREGRVMIHHNYFFCLLVCIWVYVLVSISSSSGFHRHTQTPSPGGVAFLPNKKNTYFPRICFIPPPPSLSMCVCAHVLRDRLCFVSLLFPNNPCSEPFHLYSCEILVEG